MGVSTTGRALLIVDLQHDFGDPAGSLYVQGAAGVLDAVLALISLGYKQVEAHKAIRIVMKSGGETPASEDLVRQALKVLS